MLIRLEVPYADTSSAALTWTLDAADTAGLARLVRTIPGTSLSLELRLLGTSHQALLGPADGPATCIETVSCSAGGAALPDQHLETRQAWSYALTSRVETLSAAALSEAAAHLCTTLGQSEDALLGLFPGSRTALTALHVVPHTGGIAWRTWHAYPNTGEMVRTKTVVTLTPQA